jgi:hypothetical protein
MPMAEPPRERERGPITRAEMGLLRSAANPRSRWNVPDPVRTEAILAVADILDDATSSDRDRLAAVRTLVAMDRTDQADDRLDLRRGLPAGAPLDEGIDPAIAAAALRVAREGGRWPVAGGRSGGEDEEVGPTPLHRPPTTDHRPPEGETDGR